MCAGAPAEKWRANKEPEADRANLERLMGCLQDARADVAVLISTVDVYPRPVQVDESTEIALDECHPYGRHRLELERFVAGAFPQTFILRLPGLFGPGLKKNLIYDLLHGTGYEVNVHPDSTFQFYDVAELWRDVQLAIEAGLPLLNLATPPLRAGDVGRECFGREWEPLPTAARAEYDMRTRLAEGAGREGPYLRSAEEVLGGLRSFAERERPR